MDRFLGIDAGGTTTRAVLLDSTAKVLGVGSAGSGNYHDAGIAKAVENMRLAAQEAFRASGETPTPVRALFAGCAGVKSRLDIDRVTTALVNGGLAAGGSVRVCNDLHNALAGGLSGRPGIALIAGTGSNCLGQDASGASWMCGGWGWLLDAPGSAFGLTLAAMRTATREADGRDPQGPLLTALLDFLGISEADDLLARLYCEKWTPEDLAAFAPVIVETAKQGDVAALRILREGARALAELVATTALRLDFPDGPEVVVLGGCARSGAPYQPLVEEAIREACPNARIVEPAGPPLRGAALNALRLGGVDLPADFQLP
jgi:N-acetylglucosamine kinase-like BadF-type ATPase